MAQQLNSGLGRLDVEVSRSPTISHTHTHTHTHTHDRTPLNEWSARRRYRYLHNTQQTQGTNIHQGTQRNSNPQSHQSSDCRPTHTARLPAPTLNGVWLPWITNCLSTWNQRQRNYLRARGTTSCYPQTLSVKSGNLSAFQKTTDFHREIVRKRRPAGTQYNIM